jgi:hypothetical protein
VLQVVVFDRELMATVVSRMKGGQGELNRIPGKPEFRPLLLLRGAAVRAAARRDRSARARAGLAGGALFGRAGAEVQQDCNNVSPGTAGSSVRGRVIRRAAYAGCSVDNA